MRNRLRQCIDIFGRDQRVRQSSINLRNAADFGRDEGHAGSGGFQHDVGQGFRARRYHHDAAERLRLACRHGRPELHGIGEAQTLHLRAKSRALWPVPHQRGGDNPAVAMKLVDGTDQDVDTFYVSEFAHEHQIGGVGFRQNRFEFLARYPIVDDADEPARLADFAAKNLRAICAFKQKQISTQHQDLLGRKIEFTRHCIVTKQKAAAMGRVGANRAPRIEGHAGIGAAFRTVAVHDIGTDLRNPAHDMGQRDGVSESDVAAHRKSADAERERGRKFTENLISARAAGVAVRYQSDTVATGDLLAREVEDVTEQAANRRTKDVQDVQRRHCADSPALMATPNTPGNDDKPCSSIARIPPPL